MKLQKIQYKDLKAKQKEAYNYQKIAAILADYGFLTIKLDDDWQGADFLALHADGKKQLKIQLKARLTFDKKYKNKNIHICFPHKKEWYLYNHDILLRKFLEEYKKTFIQSKSWQEKGGYSWATISQKNYNLLEQYRINNKKM